MGVSRDLYKLNVIPLILFYEFTGLADNTIFHTHHYQHVWKVPNYPFSTTVSSIICIAIKHRCQRGRIQYP